MTAQQAFPSALPQKERPEHETPSSSHVSFSSATRRIAVARDSPDGDSLALTRPVTKGFVMKIGFIGLGHMGSGMAANLLKAGTKRTSIATSTLGF